MSVAGHKSPGTPGTLRSALEVLRSEQAHSRILSGSVVMLVGSGIVSAVNFGYNVAVARLLGPAAFGHAAAAVTLLMLVSAITLAFQLVCAKFVAKNETAGQRSNVYRTLLRRAWIAGIALGSLLMLTSAPVAKYLHMPSPRLIVLLAIGVAFYIPLGVKRGGLQGICSFRKLTANFVLEALVRFGGAIVLIETGHGVVGAVGAIAASVVVAYFLPLTPVELDVPGAGGLPASFREGMQAIVFFVGQVIINNIDILLVKHFFTSEMAGLYAGVALVGRVLYFFSWSVVSAMFPVSASSGDNEESPTVLVVPLGIVLSISVAFTLALGLFPDFVLQTVFGARFGAAGHQMDSLLMLYAAATGVYSLAVVLMAYEMSRKLANTGWIQLAFSAAIVFGICMFHSTLRDVIVVQLVLMVVLLVAASLPFFRLQTTSTSRGPTLIRREFVAAARAPKGTMTRIRRVSEAEVMASFLRNEFHHPEYNRDRERFARWVMTPNFANEAENALRRALLFRRRESMWQELPADTQWWEVELTPSDLDRVRVFPRAQWRKVASGDFGLRDIVQRIRHGKVKGGTRTVAFVSRLFALSAKLQAENNDKSAILLIGIDEGQPLTVMEGNHRITAAMLASPEVALSRFRYICGFSPNMTNCCWYETTLTTLWRYARNRLKILMYDREAELARLIHSHEPSLKVPDAVDRTNEALQKEAS